MGQLGLTDETQSTSKHFYLRRTTFFENFKMDGKTGEGKRLTNLLQEANIDFDQLIHLRLKELKENLKDLSPGDSKFLMRKRRQCKNIKSADNCRRRQKIESKEKDLVISQLRKEIVLIEERHKKERQRLEEFLIIRNHEGLEKSMSTFGNKEKEVIKYAKMFQEHILDIQIMVRLDKPKLCLQEELSKLAADIADFSSYF